MDEKDNKENINLIKETMFGLPHGIISKIIHNNVNLNNYRIRKEAVNTLSKCLSIFILYITEGAIEHCENEKRSTLFVRDILNSLDDSLFLDIYDELKKQVDIQEENNKKETSKNNENDEEKDVTSTEANTKNKEDDFDLLLQALE
ncbi:CCAAT-binding transcription factor [Plasmodium brasilianum]|uniref:CCAAT-binding transcription factor, putative n=2 Tax=Plasmodium (Plasmodium) TaxID=418103 RepID=A0A1A8WAS4_PLAMA|nr:CCAAT-binding transcription factor, putative [Plasmodium malariae]KAI4834653.1 CCAAT-binding transcription factor [Plasmodium brasilianum]SBS90115.1 CCAAT-binding transcription factor, putative [Plasmodium malariae]SCP03194.1 CCAAT-binding transcription factor, putative [Plasmodium malariae]